MKLPHFTGRDLKIEPPFSFQGVSACVFPLRASLDTLQLLCDQYLNTIPKELGYFRASIPYVYLMTLDYGRLALKVTNLGWFAQREVAFTVPLEWYRWVDGEWVFQQWAVFTPFVYVDDTVSMTLGRSVLGWPKTFVTLEPQISGWLREPSGPTTEVSISAKVFSKTYAGRRLTERVFLDVRGPGSHGVRLPPDLDSPLLPWNMFSNMTRNMLSFSRDSLNLLKGFGFLPLHEASGVRNAWERISKISERMSPLRPDFSAATLNLKQFRFLENPEKYCYQALTSGSIRYTSFNRGGLLGDVATASGDQTGGYVIKLTTYPSMPLVETLGLDVTGQLTSEEVQVLELEPVMPFWYNVDMEYERASTVAWRTNEGIWHDEKGRRYPPKGGVDAPGEDRFNTTLGAASPVVPGPFQFAEVVSHVIPLLAKRNRLESYLDAILNEPLSGTGERFTVWGTDPRDDDPTAHVYLVFNSYGDVHSPRNNVGDWANLSLAIYIPVQHYRGEELLGVGFTPFVVFADTVSQVCTLSELYGIPALKSEFDNSRGSWIEREVDDCNRLLSIRTEVLPAVGEGQKTRLATVLSIGGNGSVQPKNAREPSRVRQAHEKYVQGNVERRSRSPKTAPGSVLAEETLGGRPWNVFTLMQVRDAGEPSKACYQALHRIYLSIQEITRLGALDDGLYVDIVDYPTLAIVESLGLIATERSERGGAVTHRLAALSPFLLRHSYEAGATPAQRRYYRTDAEEWKRGSTSLPVVGMRRTKRSGLTSGEGLTGSSDKTSAETAFDPRAIAPQTLLEQRLRSQKDAGR